VEDLNRGFCRWTATDLVFSTHSQDPKQHEVPWRRPQHRSRTEEVKKGKSRPAARWGQVAVAVKQLPVLLPPKGGAGQGKPLPVAAGSRPYADTGRAAGTGRGMAIQRKDRGSGVRRPRGGRREPGGPVWPLEVPVRGAVAHRLRSVGISARAAPSRPERAWPCGTRHAYRPALPNQ